MAWSMRRDYARRMGNLYFDIENGAGLSEDEEIRIFVWSFSFERMKGIIFVVERKKMLMNKVCMCVYF